MFVIYETIPEETIRKDAKKTIKGITKWFEENPKRKICRVETWYGKTIRVKKNTISKQVNAAAENAIKGK